jgi:DNA-binding Lrp family transcriptional regulator
MEQENIVQEDNQVEQIAGNIEPDDLSVFELPDERIEELLTESLKESDSVDEPTPESGETQEQPQDVAATDTQPAEEASSAESQSDGKDSIQVSKAEWEKVKKQLERQEDFIHRRNAEIGELRKQRRELQAQLKVGLDELKLEDPLEAFDRKQKIQELDKEISNLDQEESRMRKIHESQKILAETLSPEEANVELMVATLKRDGLPDSVINRFVSNPYDVAHVDTIIQLGKRARAEQVANVIAHHASNKIQELEGKIKELEQQLSVAPKTILNGVQRALKKQPEVSAVSGSSSKSVTNINPLSMSDEEIEAFLQSQG